MSPRRTSFKDPTAVSPEQQQAWEAVRYLTKTLPTLTTFARAVARDDKVRVQISDKGSRTDGKTIWLAPTLDMGKKLTHQREVCGARDENSQQICKACDQQDQIFRVMFHEIAHLVYGSFEKVPNWEIKDLIERTIAERGRKAGSRANKIMKMLGEAPNYQGMSLIISPFMPYLINCLEDSRVNAAMFRAREGTFQMFRAHAFKAMDQGMQDADGVWHYWHEMGENAQASIGLFCKVSGYDYSNWFIRPVVTALDDPEITALCEKVKNTSTMKGIYTVAYPILERLRELGFFKSPNDVEDDPEPERKPEPQKPQEGEKDDDQHGDGEPSDESQEGGESSGEPESGGQPSDDEDDSAGGDDATDEDADSQSGAGGDETSSDDRSVSPDSDLEGDLDDGDHDEDSDDGECESADDADSSREGDDSSGGSSDLSQQGDPGDENHDSDGDGSNSDEAKEEDEVDESDRDSDDPLTTGSGFAGSGGRSDETEVPGGSDQSDQDGEQKNGDRDSDLGQEQVRHSPGDPEGDDGDLPGGSEERDSDPSEDTDNDPVQSEDDNDLVPGHSDSAGSRDVPDTSSTADQSGQEGSGDSDECPQDQEMLESDDPADKEPDIDPADQRMEEDPQEVERFLQMFGGHGMDADNPNYQYEQNVIAVAVKQSDNFDSPSATIGGVRVHKFDSRDARARKLAWAYAEPRMYPNQKAQIDSYKPAEALIGRALLTMRTAFANNKKAKRTEGHRSGRINSPRLASVMTGNDKVFRRSTLPGKKDYFVVLSLDVSYSTSSQLKNKMARIDAIKKMGMALGDMLARVGVHFEIYAHTGFSEGGSRSTFDLDVFSIKEEHEPWSDSQRQRLATLAPSGSNIDGHMLEFCRKRVERSSATDKIILYCTDGDMPEYNYSDEIVVLERELALCKKKDYEIIGIGVETDSPSAYGLQTIRIDDPSDIVKLVTELDRRLTK